MAVQHYKKSHLITKMSIISFSVIKMVVKRDSQVLGDKGRVLGKYNSLFAGTFSK